MLIDRFRASSPREALPLAPLIILHRLKPNLVKCNPNFDPKTYHLHVYDVYYVPEKRGRKNTDPRKNVNKSLLWEEIVFLFGFLATNQYERWGFHAIWVVSDFPTEKFVIFYCFSGKIKFAKNRYYIADFLAAPKNLKNDP